MAQTLTAFGGDRLTQSSRAVLWLALLWTLGAAASPATDKEARAKFGSAQAAYEVGKFEKALELYGEAYNLKPLPAFLFNMAQCHKQLGNFERALFFYRRFLAQAPAGTDTETVEQLIAAMEQRQAQKEQLALAQQDQQRQAGEAAQRLEAQRQQVEVERAREAAARAEVDAADRKAKLLVPPPTASLLPAPPPPDKPIYERWWFWTAVGVVAAGSVTAAAVASAPRAELPSYGTLNAR